MAIYKSSFNQKPEKEEKPKKEKREKIKQPKQKSNVRINVRPSLISLIVCLILLVVCCFSSNFLKNFLLGTFGLLIYPLTLIGAFFSILALKRKKITARKKYVAFLATACLIVWFILHLILTSKLSTASFGVYLSESYKAKTTAGGIAFSLISYPIIKFLTVVGAYIFSAIALAIFVGLIVDYLAVEKNLVKVEGKSKFDFKSIEDFDIDGEPIQTISHEEEVKHRAKKKLGLEKGESTIISSNMPHFDFEQMQKTKPEMSKKDYILTPLDPVIPRDETKELFSSIPKKPYPYEKINKPQKSNFGFSTRILYYHAQKLLEYYFNKHNKTEDDEVIIADLQELLVTRFALAANRKKLPDKLIEWNKQYMPNHPIYISKLSKYISITP